MPPMKSNADEVFDKDLRFGCLDCFSKETDITAWYSIGIRA